VHSVRRKPAAVVFSIFAALCPCAFGLDPSLDISQYAHNSWTIRNGFFKGLISSIAQTPDGYLWLGTEFGLLRFDGVRFIQWTPPGAERLPGAWIASLFTARDGTLWIGTREGLASWDGAKLTRYPELDQQNVASLLEDREGTIWAGTVGRPAGWLCTIRSGKTQCHGQDGSLGLGVLSLYEDAMGDLWAGAASGLRLWKTSPPKRYTTASGELTSMVQGDDGVLLVATRAGILQLAGEMLVPYRIHGVAAPRYGRLLRDRDGGLWIGTTGEGLIHLHHGRTDVFSRLEGLSSDEVGSMFEDREGNIWVATYGGLDRFRELPVVTVSAKQGLLTDVVSSVLAAKDGSVWLAGRNGLGRWKDGKVATFRKSDGLPDDSTMSLYEDDGGRIWVATYGGLARFEGGRFVPVQADVTGGDVRITGYADRQWVSHPRGLLHLTDGRLVEEFPWSRLGRDRTASALVVDRQRGGLWLGFYLGHGVVYFRNGQVRTSYTGAEGPGEHRVADLQLDPDGTLWAATDAGLSMIQQGRIATLTSKNGLPCDAIHWKMEADDHSTWLYTACGLVRISRTELDVWIANPKHMVQVTVFDGSDGVRLHANPFSSYTPHVAKSVDGKLWFTAGDGVSIFDPRQLPFNKLPPPVHIEKVIADRKVMSNARLPALTRDLEIEYTALSLVAPEKNRFKYKLEGYDRDWQDAGNRRQAFYTNLPPRKYRFRVIACNNSGVWNEAGDTLEFSIAPAYYQTNWFRAACVAGFLILLWLGYQLRLRHVQLESRKLRDVIETIPAYVWSALPDGSVDFFNRRWLEFSGFSQDQALGWGWMDALHPEDRARLDEAWRAAVASGEPMEAEARMRGADGQYRWLLFRSVPLRNGSGKIVKWYGKSMDIEALKRAEQERERLRQLESDMAHMNRVSMMGELAASVAHEVNQPLTGIVSNGSACIRLLAGQSPHVEEALEGLRDIVRDGKRAGEVIARIRAMTKRAATPKERLDLNEVVREVLVLVRDEAKKRAVSILTEFADGLAPVMGDRVQLQQVVLNLVMNAMEAMSSVSGRPRELVIHIGNVDGGQVQVTVEDSGVGLDPKTSSKIFEPFYTTKSSGMGMGLSICRSIVQSHEGRIWATAKEGPGTRFHFSLPQYHEEEQNAKVTGV